MREMMQEDWGLVIVALCASLILWWSVTQREIIEKSFVGVQVTFGPVKESLKRDPKMKSPKVRVIVRGPKSLLETSESDAFIMVADLSEISDATRNFVRLKPENLKVNPIYSALPIESIRVRREDIFPSVIEVPTVWNSAVARIIPKYDRTPALGYVVSATSISPATLTVAGSDADLELNRFISNRNELKLDGQTRSFTKVWTIEDLAIGDLEVLDDPLPDIRFEITIAPVFMDRYFKELPIQVLGNRKYSVDPTRADLLVNGERLKIQSITEDSLAFQLDPSLLSPGPQDIKGNALRVINLPEGVTILAVTPEIISISLPADLGAEPKPLETMDQSRQPE